MKNELYQQAKMLLAQKRPAEAAAIYKDLAIAGDTQSQIFLGWMYAEGLGVERDNEQALHWFRNAASLGSKEGAFHCGKSALAQNQYEEALDWFRKAAAQDYGPALLWLGLAHLRGLGVSVNLHTGAKYLERAARSGNFPAQRELAVLMMSGKLGISKIAIGLLLFPYAVIAACIGAISNGHSDKLIY